MSLVRVRGHGSQAGEPPRALKPIQRTGLRPSMTTNPVRLVPGILLCAVLLAMAASCSVLDRRPRVEGPIIDDVRLREDLGSFEDYAYITIRETANEIQGRASEREVRRNAILWKARATDAFQIAMGEERARRQLVASWLLAIQMERFFGSGPGRETFGGQQALALNASNQIRSRIEGVARDHLRDEDFQQLRRQLNTIAEQQPWKTIGDVRTTEQGLRSEVGSTALNAITTIGTAPITAVAGIGRGAGVVTDLPGAASRINRTIEEFPEELRWQAELLYTDIENSDTVTSLVLATDLVAASADRLSRAADELPEDVQRILDRTLETVRRDQAVYQETLRLAQGTATDARATAENTRAAIVEAQELGRTLDATARTINETLAAYAALVEGDPDASPPEDPVTPDDIAAMARDIGDAASELRLTMEELGTLAEDRRLAAAAERAATAATRAAVEETAPLLAQGDERARGIIDHAFKRGLQLLLGLLAVLVLWEIVRWGLNRGRSKRKNPES